MTAMKRKEKSMETIPRLNKRFFFERMKELKVAYPSWNFDTGDKTTLMVWYKQSCYLNDEQFGKLVNWYMSNKTYPPRSCVELTQCYREIFKEQYPTGLEIEEEIIGWIRKYGDDGYDRAMKHCPTLIEKIPISYYGWRRLCSDYDSMTELRDRYLSLVDNEVEAKCQRIQNGEIGLPLTESGRLITYRQELEGMTSDEEVENDKKINGLAGFLEGD